MKTLKICCFGKIFENKLDIDMRYIDLRMLLLS